ncbi:MAG: MCP four helix bundle domain-containing protein [Solirubrobacteraceae bacterium]|nr:MCP four helix bundle domain-containing protein [Solirubrobacteraceae bacterium]
MPRTIPIAAKLYCGFALVLLLSTLVGMLAITSLKSVEEKGASMYGDRVVPMRDLADVRGLLGDIDSQIQRAITTSGDTSPYAEVSDADWAKIGPLMRRYRSTELLPAEQRGLRTLEPQLARYQRAYTAVLDAASRGDDAEAVRRYFAIAGSLYNATDGTLAELIAVNDKEALALTKSISDTHASARTKTLLLLGLAVLLGAIAAYVITRGITRGIKQVLNAVNGIAEGDIDQHIDVKSRDEVGAMARAAQQMTDYLKTIADGARRVADGDLTAEIEPRSERDALGTAFAAMIANLRELVGKVAGTATTLSAASQQMASTSEETGRAVSEIANAVGEVAAGAQRQVSGVTDVTALGRQVVDASARSASDADATAQAAEEARTMADEGASAVVSATEAMTSVREASGQATDAIRELGTKSEAIGGIVETITGIAEQTNLLALNAAIEAARAGEQGRGFAVVADEVRKLAEESQAASQSIAELVAEIQAETGRAVEVVERGAARTEQGSATVEQARAAFERIGTSVNDMTARVGQIAAAVQEISASAHRMDERMADVSAVAEESSASTEQVSASTEQTSASAQEIAASAEELAAHAGELEQLVHRFTLA